jgi:AcrR family transcriptional regulator
MDAPQGRREANKQATREALADSARRLFAERGYAGTTVRDIAADAGVTERTFYRYFGDKSALLAEELRGWIERLGRDIVARPASESDLDAVEAAVLSLARRRARETGETGRWLHEDPRRGMDLIRASMPRPLLRLEGAIAAALLERAAAQGRDLDAFRADVVSRISIAVVRNALLGFRAQEAGEGRPVSLITLLRRGFAVARDL